ncbi:MAG: FtsX-like permease family protein [Acidobacteriaceae bacterium]|nr:FtsX-like permease family protein [Acidobacteriaceae bacterium]
MSILAWKNLLHDRVRLIVTLTGIVFALVLIAIQFGMFLGFLDTAANIVENNSADLWISAPGIPHVNGGSPIQESKRWKALQVPGVTRTANFAIFFVNWKLPNGAFETCQIAGFDLDSGMGGPWNLVAGRVEDLRGEDTVIIDDLYKTKLGVHKIGETLEINGKRARIVGFTHGIRSFTTAPYVFTSFKNAQNYIPMREHETIFILLRTAPGANLPAIKTRLLATIPGIEIFTHDEILLRTRNYWVFGTGAGTTTLMGAILGLLVGIVVVAQTIYAATIDHLKEFGTLKAMGATNGQIYQVIILQSALAAVMGYVFGISVALAIVGSTANTDLLIKLPWPVALGIFGLTLFMCMSASLLSIRKATTIDPAMVFRG